MSSVSANTETKKQEQRLEAQLAVIEKGLRYQRQRLCDHHFEAPMSNLEYGMIYRAYEEFVDKRTAIRAALFDIAHPHLAQRT
jgi:hypothetical protein